MSLRRREAHEFETMGQALGIPDSGLLLPRVIAVDIDMNEPLDKLLLNKRFRHSFMAFADRFAFILNLRCWVFANSTCPPIWVVGMCSWEISSFWMKFGTFHHSVFQLHQGRCIICYICNYSCLAGESVHFYDEVYEFSKIPVVDTVRRVYMARHIIEKYIQSGMLFHKWYYTFVSSPFYQSCPNFYLFLATKYD